MKKTFALVALSSLLMVNSIGAFAQKTVQIKLNGQEIKTDAPGYVKNNRTLVPIRFISESLGYEVEWDEDDREITIEKGNTEIELKVGSTKVEVNNVEKTIEVAPEINQNRTFVPIRFIAENFGVNVEWDSANYIVLLNTDGSSNTTNTNSNLTTEENTYLAEFNSLTSKLQSKMNQLKGYYFENSSKYSKAEIETQYQNLKKEIDEIVNSINSISVPEKFKSSSASLKEAATISKEMIEFYNSALIDGKSDAAKNVVNYQTQLSIKLSEVRNKLEAEIKGETYSPDKNIKSYNDNSNLLEDSTIQNLMDKL
ncbi:Copper amine oxidase N-terminal domain-containing protein [Anaerosphaera aminiphila DSM 21120]|uniref:Copper amine oxidase N-terminal domain-containing protein n=1 Tax=Anaerosphaera aminiphila DSM 21120 TaxID=1120995 RepID=A0A1M5RYE3_9FIRM|nr:copper amine oxidase N-terminal domain-containing protein [Anaerosphaera aminiphila]SHH31387.1 Copper amine oxidase N-terminal domain-containing protein [Anaerosphaera aminiphila DSM 21120]